MRVFLNGQKGKGVIDREDLREVCREFGVRASEAVLDDLMRTCDADQDGVLDFLEFANFLNWKQKMPLSRAEQRVLTGRSHVSILCDYYLVPIVSRNHEDIRRDFLRKVIFQLNIKNNCVGISQWLRPVPTI